jgi:uncharacterized repeat protein (TIGR03803 family)
VRYGLNYYAGVIFGPQGNLYGTTALYAISNTLFPTGMGSVFSVRTNGFFTRLYRFGTVLNSHGQPLDGASPQAPLVNGPGDCLYGTTYYGGTNGYTNGYGRAGPGYGTVFQITTNGLLTALHSFLGSDGANPTGLTLGRDTNFYGVASHGGANTKVVDTNGDVGFGTIFKVTTNGLVTILYSFGTVTDVAGHALDGAQPNPLVQGSDGNFYGSAAFGGSNTTIVDSSRDVGYGTVFKIDTNGILTSLYSFGTVTNSTGTPLDGANPAGPLVQGADGNFYGVTESGGSENTGTIFVITPTGTLTTLYSFGPTNLPGFPLGYYSPMFPCGGLLVASDGTFYGTTCGLTNGEGFGGFPSTSSSSVFQLSPAAPVILNPPATVTIPAGATNSFAIGVEAIYATGCQWQFDATNLNDGGEITGSATTNLILTGVTLADTGTYTIIATNAYGTAKASGVLTVVPALIKTQPASATIPAGATNNFMVGVTSVYPASYQWRFDGTNLTDGGEFSGSSTSNLTVTGAALCDSGTYSVVVSNAAGVIQSADAALAVEPFIIMRTPASLTVMAGATATFGVAVKNIGAISYQWRFDGTNLSDGGNISGSATTNLVITNAATINSGTYSVMVSNTAGSGAWAASLTVIPQTAAGCCISNLHSFTSAGDGGHPNGLVLGCDGALYGTTSFGGSNSVPQGGGGDGTFFKFTTDGTLSTLYSFAGGSDETDPEGPLVQASNGCFYGITASEING